MRSIKWCHFQWPWTNPNPVFKVTPLFGAKYLTNGYRYGHIVTIDLNKETHTHKIASYCPWRTSRIDKSLPYFAAKNLATLSTTHSLTHCCAWPAEGRSVLHIERSWPAIQAAPTDRPTSSSTCCSQFLRGRPGGRFQSAAGGVPVWASIDSW